MNKKQNDLLQFLLKQTKPVTSKEISSVLNFSTRSVKNYVNEINTIYKQKVILSSKSGYEVNPHFSSSLFTNYDVDIPQTNEERSFYIIKQLLLGHGEAIDLFNLCDFLCVSYSTIKLLIAKMNKTYTSYHISFICEKDTLHIEGTEKDKRKLISFIINEESKNSFSDISALKKYFMNIDVDALSLTVQNCFKKYDFYLNDFARVNLLMHLLEIINGSLNGCSLLTSNTIFEIENETDSLILTELCYEIEKMFDINFTTAEKNEILILLKTNVNYSIPKTKTELTKLVGKEIIDLCDFYIERINSLYLIDLSEDNFLAPFALHLKNLLFRLYVGKTVKNSMAETIRVGSPVVYDIAIFISLDLSKRYGTKVDIDETAFLAMHVGAEIERQNANLTKAPAVLVCPNYRDISTTVVNKLLLNFSNQIKMISSFNSEEDLQNHIELFEKEKHGIIFSTIQLNNTYSFEIINISPFNLEAQYNMIQERLSRSKDMYVNYKLRKNFHDFFEEGLFTVSKAMTNKTQVLSYLCDQLRVKNYIDDEFEENVYKRENAATTAFGNIAIPHSMEMDAVKTCVAVLISKDGIRWDNNIVHVVFLMSINKADKKTFRYLYESLITLFLDNNCLQEAKKCTSFKDFENLIYSNLKD